MPSPLPLRLRGRLEALAAAFLPGCLIGVHLAGLIFFLNPQIPFTPGPVIRGVLFYGLLLGAASLVLHLPFIWRRPRRARRWLPWALTLALAGAALLDWTHASFFAYFLPPGINERLIKTALWLSLGALMAFYTALLHTLQRRRYGWRSRSAYVLLTLLSVYAMVERREAFRPQPSPSPRPATVEPGQRPRLWVLGIDTATLDALLPLAGEGRLPFLAGVLRQGAYGRLESISPPRREALWTTLATGKYPYKHGVKGGRGFRADWIAPGAELLIVPEGIGFRNWGIPGRRRAPAPPPRQVLPLWEILPRLGIPSGVVGWPAAPPLSPQLSFALPESFFERPDEPAESRPPDLAERARLFRVRPEEIDPDLWARFGSAPPRPVLEALSNDLWRQALSFNLLEESQEVDAVFLTLPGLRQVSVRDFGGFAAVQFEGAKDPELEEASERLAAWYGQLDAYLADLWKRQQGPRLLVLVSVYGVEGESGWPQSRSSRRAGSFKRAPDGLLMLHGEGIRTGALLTEARLVDVVPTLMYA
ncbi:MAG TPA: alkaline phosphatase family protein, partial [Thermoanaerobaculia bacterium]|nr:alkaline phosphatase family protein [Thermoanaerobaculia bacterium]